jgi:hypothetical protein
MNQQIVEVRPMPGSNYNLTLNTKYQQKLKNLTIAVLASTLFLGSCTNDTNEEKSLELIQWFFIINEGGFCKSQEIPLSVMILSRNKTRFIRN